MAGKKGYEATRALRVRTKQERGGNHQREEYLADTGNGNFAGLRDAYLADLFSLNYRQSTIDGRRKDLRHFLEWGHARSLDRAEGITRRHLESYRRYLANWRKSNGKPLGVSTQRGRLSVVKDFFRWLCKRDYLPANPASELEMPRPEKQLPEEALTEYQVKAILAQPDVKDPLGVRDRAMMELFYSTGVRRGELVKLELNDLNRERETLHLRHTKGRKDRIIPVGQRALEWLERYLDEVRPRLEVDANEAALFLTGYGGGFNPDVLGRQVSKYIAQAEIGRSGGCHLFRHTCATHMLEAGADIRMIQQLLGHEKLETTAIYTEVSILQLQAVHRRCHPAGGESSKS